MATTRDRYEIEVATKNAQKSIGGLTTAVKGFIGVLAVREVIQFGNTILDSARKFQTYENQLRLITKGTEDLDRVMGLLQQSAIRSRTSFDAFLELFVKLRVTTESLAISEERVIAVTEKLSQALQVAGADGNTAASVIRQFGQAMASGEVRGDEFRSIVEGLGPALAIMARESGKTVGELRKLSREGDLTAEVMFELFENSTALTNAFEKQETTIAQLETQFGDAFDRMANKLAEQTGLSKAYSALLEQLIRQFDRIAGTEGSIVNLDPDQILQKVQEDAITATEAVEELQKRLDIARGAGGGSGRLAPDEVIYLNQKEAIEELLPKLQELADVEKEKADAAQKALEQQQENQKELNRLINEQVDGLGASLKIADEFAKKDFRTPIEKAREEYEKAVKTLQDLQTAQEIVNQNQDLNTEGLIDYTDAINDAQAAVNAYRKELEELTEAPFDQFYRELIEANTESVQKIEFAKQALEKLKEQHDAGVISAEVYAKALEDINGILDIQSEKTSDLADRIKDYNQSIMDSTADARFELESLNLTPFQKQLAEIERDLRTKLNRQIRELESLKTPDTAKEIDAQIQAITNSTNKAIEEQKRIAEQVYEQQRSFEYGWRKAFESYEDDATNAAKKAEEIFKKTTQGIEDTIVNFVKTGKFEFKSLVADILETLLRSQIQQTIAQIFQATNLSSGFGNLSNPFAGFFANGGMIPAGQFGVVGERGPELVTGPAQVTPLTGGGNVTYNINAVDASSFKQLVARDPEFIHAVALKGGRSIPGGR